MNSHHFVYLLYLLFVPAPNILQTETTEEAAEPEVMRPPINLAWQDVSTQVRDIIAIIVVDCGIHYIAFIKHTFIFLWCTYPILDHLTSF